MRRIMPDHSMTKRCSRVAQLADLADLLAFRIVDADPRADVARIVVGDHAHARPRHTRTSLRSASRVTKPSSENESTTTRASMSGEDLGGRWRDLVAPIERALALLHVDALLGDTVRRGRVPSNQRLPHVIVPEIAVLVVRSGSRVRHVGREQCVPRLPRIELVRLTLALRRAPAARRACAARDRSTHARGPRALR